MIKKLNNFFILPVSPFPLVSSILAFNLLLSLNLSFKFNNWLVFIMSNLILIPSCFIWWENLSMELNLESKLTWSFELGIKLSMIFFILSEVLFFVSMFWSYFHSYLSPNLDLGALWPPSSIKTFELTGVPLVNTMILLLSGVTVTLSHYNIITNKKNTSIMFLAYTISLGLIFTFLQKMEYNESFFSMTDSVYGTAFFMITGFHGLHVMIGSAYLFYCIIHIKVYTKNNFLMFDMASWYWHFVDVVWIYVFFFLYYLPTL